MAGASVVRLAAFLAYPAHVADVADIADVVAIPGPRTAVSVPVLAHPGAEAEPQYATATEPGPEPGPEPATESGAALSAAPARHPDGDGPSAGRAAAARRPATARHSVGPGGLTGATLPGGPVVGSGEARDAKPPSVQIP